MTTIASFRSGGEEKSGLEEWTTKDLVSKIGKCFGAINFCWSSHGKAPEPATATWYQTSLKPTKGIGILAR